jgi:hypothetical protein
MNSNENGGLARKLYLLCNGLSDWENTKINTYEKQSLRKKIPPCNNVPLRIKHAAPIIIC